MFEGYTDITFSVDMTIFTKIPIKERSIYIPLAMMVIPENRYGLLSARLRSAHAKCLAMALEILRGLRASQHSMLAFLSDLPPRLIARDKDGRILCSEELAGMSIGVTNALNLLSDPRVALLIPGVVSGILAVKELMYHRQYRPDWENLAAEKEATIAINRLMSHLASMKIFGGRNSQILACARNRESHSPAVDWLPMHTE
jgi:hypothetical protein